MKRTRLFLISLILAFGTWFIYTLSLDYSGIISVSVIARSNLEGYTEYSTSASTVSARCRTSGYSLLRYRLRSKKSNRTVFFAAEDLKKAGESSFAIGNADLGRYLGDIFSESVVIESLLGSEVEFVFTREEYVKVPVRGVTMFSYKPQYTSTGPLSFAPDSVLVYGDPGFLASVDHINTKTLVLNGISSNMHGVVQLDIPSGVRCSVNDVSYSIGAARFVEVSRSMKVEIEGVPHGKSLSIYPGEAEVRLKVRFPVNEALLENLSLVIRYDDFLKSESGRCVAFLKDVPDNVLDYGVQPQLFDIIDFL